MNNKEFLGYFETLASTSTPDSLLFSSCNDLLSTLSTLEHSQQTKGNVGHSSPFGSEVSPDLDYTLKRIVRSLTTDNVELQMRFALALKELLSRFPAVMSTNFVDFLLKECDLKKTVKKSEKNHFLVAKMLGLEALLRARKIDESLFSYVIEIIFADIAAFDAVQDFGLKIIADSLKSQRKEDLRMKIKVVSQKFKGFFKPDQPSHYSIVFAIAKSTIQTLKSPDFPFKKALEKNIGDYANLVKLLVKSTEKFPKEPVFLEGVIESLQEAGVSWNSFFEFLLEELTNKAELTNNFDYKKAFIVLKLFYRFLKRKDFSIENLKDLKLSGLIGLWVRNLSVQNKVLRECSVKIEKKIVKIMKNCEKNKENREIIYDWVVLMKEKPVYKFLGSNEIAKVFFVDVLDEEMSEKYWKFLKKRLSSAEDSVNKIFILSEILHFTQWRIEALSEDRIKEILAAVFHETFEDKIRKIIEKSEEEKENADIKSEIAKTREKVFDFFHSLLSLVIKRKSSNFSQKKGLIWKGLGTDNRPLLLAILSNCNQEHVEHFQKRSDFIKKIKAFSQSIDAEEADFRKKLAFLLLLSSVALMSFQFPDESFDSIIELFQAKDEIFGEPVAKVHKKRKTNDGTAKNIPNNKAIAILVDLLVSLLTKAPNFLREVVRRTFREFVENIEKETLQNLTNVITRKNEEYINDMVDAEGE